MKFIRAFLLFILKTIKWTIIVLVSSTILFGVYFYFQTETPESFEKMSSQDKKTFKYLSKIYNVFEKNPEKIWDANYQFQKEPLILMSKESERGIHQSIYLINLSSQIDTSKYQKVTFPKEMNLNDVYVTSWFGFNETLFNWYVNFNFIDINGKNVLAFGVNPNQLIDNSVELQFPYFMPHEAFHEYKQVRNGWLYDQILEAQGYGESIKNYPHNKEHYDLLTIEYNLLHNAVNQFSDKDALLKTMTEWVKIREQRYSKWPNLRRETNSETMEGTANYIEVKLYEAGVHKYNPLRSKANPNPNDKFTYNGQYQFNEVMDIIKKRPSIAYALERNMSYDKGATIALILDIIDPQWKNKIGKIDGDKMPTLYDIIKKKLATN